MSKINLIIALCVRDCEAHLSGVLLNIKNIRSLFNKTMVIFVESDSHDATLDIINEYSEKNEAVKVINHGNLSEKISERTDRIAHCRNSYLDVAEGLKDEYQYLLILDGDSASSEMISDQSILSNFKNDDWDMVTSNQPEGYYDIWALRHEGLMPFDCWKEYSKYNTKEAFDYFITSRFLKIHPDEEWIQVQSAFGGAGIIKIESIKGARHIGHTDDGSQICEWVPFCNFLNDSKARIFINPKFINSTVVSEHIKANLAVFG